MIWQIVTKSPIPPMETPNPSITIWSNAANVAALIKLDYLNTILSWLDIVGPKSSSGWKAVIGFNTVCVPSLTPKASVVNVWELLDPTQICLKRKQLEEKSNEGDGHLSETVPTANASTRSESVLDEEESPGVPAESLKLVGDETLGQNQKDQSTISKDYNDDENFKDSLNDEGLKTANDDSAVTVSKPNRGEDEGGDGCFNESIKKAANSFVSDKQSHTEPATVVQEKEGVDETKAHENITDDNAEFPDEEESVISSKPGECAEWLNTKILTKFPSHFSIFSVTIHNKSGDDIHDNVLDASKVSFPGKGLKQLLINQKDKMASKEAASVKSLSSEFMSICK